MKSRHLQHAALVMLILAAAMPRVRAAESAEPIYPNAARRLQGVPGGAGLAQYETADPVGKVDAWYGAHLPKSCRHESAKGGAKYACPGTNIMITSDKGKTVITQMASWIGGR